MPPSSRAWGCAATLIGGFAGGFVARRYSLAASLWIGGLIQALANLSLLLAGFGRRQLLGFGAGDHGRKLHQRRRHRDLCRLPLGAVPKPAAYRNTICAAHRACRGRPHRIFHPARATWQKPPDGRCSLQSVSWSRCRASSCWHGCSGAAILKRSGPSGFSAWSPRSTWRPPLRSSARHPRRR